MLSLIAVGDGWDEDSPASEHCAAKGHGRGLGNDGPMLIPTDTHEHVKDDPIRADTVFVLKPYAYRSDGPNYDEGHRNNVTWGDSVVVREYGAERLGTRPHALITVE